MEAVVYGDFSRFLDGLYGQYSGVLAQQGRLLLDAELNEQSAILLDVVRCLTTDVLGPFAGPAQHAGFAVQAVIGEKKTGRAVVLGGGRYYVYGLRCEVPSLHQPADTELPIGVHEAPFVVYLAVWEQAVSAVQAPDLVDPALGANVPDTTRRRQIRWRPVADRHLPDSDQDLTGLSREAITRAFEEYNADPRPVWPALAACAHSSDESEPGPKSAPTAWGYRGVENQLYRVEVHDPGDSREATIKFSRDNGCAEFGLESLSGPDDHGVRTATLRRVWFDARQGLEVGDWVEFVDDHWAPFGSPAPLMQVKKVSLATRQVWLQDVTERHYDIDPWWHPLLRRWDQQPNTDAHEPSHGIPVWLAEQDWYELEDGVLIRFEAPGARYERGDFWMIPARTATNDVLWPRSQGDQRVPLAIPPNGPARFLAPLALVRELQGEPEDLRTLFAPLPGEHVPVPAARGRRPAPRNR
jgi:hypothetical protein